jgi:hypothetical protein
LPPLLMNVLCLSLQDCGNPFCPAGINNLHRAFINSK